MTISSSVEVNPRTRSDGTRKDPPRTGCLIINADDWGCSRETTDRTLDCIRSGTVSSVSAMVFMEDSERAATIARDHETDAGLHINFTSPFTAPGIPQPLLAHQQRLSQYLLRNRLSQVVFHPGLTRSFDYVLGAQLDEFERLYGRTPTRVDGHHHMHLCSNVIFARLLPYGAIVRRNFSFSRREKGPVNYAYRRTVDRILSRRNRLTDFFFSLEPLSPTSRLERIFRLSRQYLVEVETHPQKSAEYSFLTGDTIRHIAAGCTISAGFEIGFANRA